jgi:hypothetical protein
MYLQCRHVRTSSDRCCAAAIKGSHWCYYHGRLHQQQESARRRRAAKLKPRLHDGTFVSPEENLGQGTCPAGSAAEAGAPGLGVPGFTQTWESDTPPLELPAVEDSASIQLALIEVLQALAANQLDPRRAGLLLYGLQVASANAKNVHVNSDSIRSISYTKEGIPLATPEHGWDVEDIEEADRLAEEGEEEEED